MEKLTAPELIVSASPHIKSPESVERILWSVIAALAPATCAGIFYFGKTSAITIALSIISAVLWEFLYRAALKKPASVGDGSAVLTGLLLALNLPPAVPWYIPVAGTGVAIIIAKQLFGGLGLNIFNPALFGRAFLLFSFPGILSTFHAPIRSLAGLDATTGATPLTAIKMGGMQKLVEAYGGQSHLYTQLLLGNHGGCIGETAIVALALGAVYLLYKGYISWHTPAAFLGTAACIAWALSGTHGFGSGDPLAHILSGGMVLGAFFMATDYATTPIRKGGKLLFGMGCGLITMTIRLKGAYPEGVMFSILIMNCFAPLLDSIVRKKPYGISRQR
jgi:Na+-translocating ferredoxin:NAD+ oxidoreductase subunit D